MLTMAMAKHQIAGGVDDEDPAPLQTGRVQGTHAYQAMNHLPAQLQQRLSAEAGQEGIQRLVDRPRSLPGASQAVEVGQHAGAGLAQLEVDLPARAEFAQEEGQPYPAEETAVVGQAVGVAVLGKVIEPVVEVGEE